MVRYSFTHNGKVMIEVQHNIDKIDKHLFKVISGGVPKVGLKASRNIIYPVFQYEAKKLIESGGEESGYYAWGYWSRKRGAGNFRLVTGKKSTWFSDRWRNKGKAEVRYPIHPRSYMRYRQSRKIPRYNEFALHDTTKLLNGWFISLEQTKPYESTTHIRNWYWRLDRHEYGTSRIPKRPIVEPTVRRMEADSVLQNQIMEYVSKEIKLMLEVEGYK